MGYKILEKIFLSIGSLCIFVLLFYIGLYTGVIVEITEQPLEEENIEQVIETDDNTENIETSENISESNEDNECEELTIETSRIDMKGKYISEYFEISYLKKEIDDNETIVTGSLTLDQDYSSFKLIIPVYEKDGSEIGLVVAESEQKLNKNEVWYFSGTINTFKTYKNEIPDDIVYDLDDIQIVAYAIMNENFIGERAIEIQKDKMETEIDLIQEEIQKQEEEKIREEIENRKILFENNDLLIYYYDQRPTKYYTIGLEWTLKVINKSNDTISIKLKKDGSTPGIKAPILLNGKTRAEIGYFSIYYALWVPEGSSTTLLPGDETYLDFVVYEYASRNLNWENLEFIDTKLAYCKLYPDPEVLVDKVIVEYAGDIDVHIELD